MVKFGGKLSPEFGWEEIKDLWGVSEVINEDIIVDCHYCEYATCSDPNSWCNCNVDDFAYFDHKVKDSKKEAEECDWFEFCDIFPKD